MSNTSSSAIDLSLLAPPDVVKQISFEEILKLRLDQFYQEMRQDQPDFPDLLESDPAMKLAQVFAYAEMLIRQDANEQALSVLLAYAKANDLDHKAAERNLVRRVISPATEMTPEIKESDESLRRRIQLAPEGQTTAGSIGSYIFHGLNADQRVKDIYPFAPMDIDGNPKGICNIYVLSTEDNGEASEDILLKVRTALNAEEIRPLTDKPVIYSASILNYSINAEIVIDQGPDSSVVLQSCYNAVKEYTEKMHGFNDGVSLSGIYQALHQSGVSRVNLLSPIANINTTLGQVAYCTEIDLMRAE